MSSFDSVTSVYIHIPFCRRRCFYCDFPIFVLGNHTNPATFPPVVEYVEILQAEISRSQGTGKPLETIFFGGGTPSLLPVELLGAILDNLAKKFDFAADIEISMEIDPATFSLEQLQGYVGAGVNRVSLGVQAFQESLLQVSGRSHTVKDIDQAVELIQRVGIVNYSLDLISGLPQQTLADWENSLEKAIALQPAHLSCYDLVLEAVTPFGKQYQPGQKPLPDDETTARMYSLASEKLALAGYQHYEISNYAKPGYQCQHNRVYWENRPYYGFGMGAASYLNQQRFTRPRKSQEYFAWVKEGCVIDVEKNSFTDNLLETLMLGLRLAEGVDLQAIEANFSWEIKKTLLEVLEPHRQRNWVIFNGDSRVRLSDPEGFLFSNIILTDLFDRLGKA
jgi:putative oxygen-independent coproporphyrinogen III oxidase